MNPHHCNPPPPSPTLILGTSGKNPGGKGTKHRCSLCRRIGHSRPACPLKKLQNVSSANVARGGLEAADDSQLEDGDDVFGVGGESHPSRKPTEPSSKRGKKEVEAELRSALEEFTASKERVAKEAAAAARLKEAHQAAPKPSGEPQIYPRQSATSPARGKATKKKLRSLAPKAGQIPPVRTARMDQTEADSHAPPVFWRKRRLLY